MYTHYRIYKTWETAIAMIIKNSFDQFLINIKSSELIVTW